MVNTFDGSFLMATFYLVTFGQLYIDLLSSVSEAAVCVL